MRRRCDPCGGALKGPATSPAACCKNTLPYWSLSLPQDRAAAAAGGPEEAGEEEEAAAAAHKPAVPNPQRVLEKLLAARVRALLELLFFACMMCALRVQQLWHRPACPLPHPPEALPAAAAQRRCSARPILPPLHGQPSTIALPHCTNASAAAPRTAGNAMPPSRGVGMCLRLKTSVHLTDPIQCPNTNIRNAAPRGRARWT